MFFERCRSHNICQMKSLGSLRGFKLCSTFLYRGASNLHSSKFKSPGRSIGGFIRASQGFFLSTGAQDVGILWQVAFWQFLIAVPVSTPSCGLIADDSGIP